MKVVDGWFCPDLLSGPGKYLRRAREDTPHAIELCRSRRVAIQAGGHIGTWPIVLAGAFEHVHTFEPVRDNFECLVKNIEEYQAGNVFPTCAALGDEIRPIDMFISGKSTGQHVARKPASGKIGAIPCLTIDDFDLENVDAIFLDLEGFEMFALRGALETIKKFRPVLMVENNKRAISQGFKPNDVPDFVRSLGYQLRAAVHEDLIFSPGA